MTDLFQIAAIGMSDGQRRLEAISQNAASNGLPGYRRHVVAGTAFESLVPSSPTSAAERGNAGSGGSAMGVNLHPGSMMATGRPLDVAIDADDQYFALTDGSRTWLTRDGAFHLNDDGVLTGDGGLRVVGTQGDVHLPGGDIKVAADGRILSKGETVASLQLFRAGDRASLVAAQGALMSAGAGVVPVADAHVRAGMLESSNTDPSHEMIDAMTVSRQFEAMSRVVQSYDEALGQAIQKLGEL
jgi:flagellar basal-body rod protein FlgF